ncbi:MAG: LptF/LptG family permease [Synergistaceae bacterium]|nr:LptF/LptG family permease [Synergistaceae bacterium]
MSRYNAATSDYFKFKVLDKFILKELMGPFFFGIMSFTIILVAGSLLFQIADLVIQRGVSMGVVIRLFIYYLPKIMAYTIPMSCLLAALLGFGKLSANSEIVALKSAGLSFQRIVRPVIIATFIISIAAFFINETIVPVSERAAANVMMYEVFKESPPLFKEKIFLKEEGGGVLKRVIYIDKMRISDGNMEEIVVQEFDDGRLARIISAKSGKWIYGSWWIEKGNVFEVNKEGAVDLLFKFDRQALTLNMDPDQVSNASQKPDQMTIPELFNAIKLDERSGSNTAKLWMIFHLRLSVPWACMVLALVGAALGSRPQRSSSSVGLGLSVIIVFVYYVILSFTQSLGDAGYLPPVIAAWIANVIFLVIGLLLCRNANKLG